MKKSVKTAIITAVVMIVTGLVIFTATMFTLGFDFTKIDNSEYKYNIYEFIEPISNIKIDLEETDINILPTEEEMVKVVCFEKENSSIKVTAEADTLIIESSEKSWYKYLSFISFDRSEITLYVPEKFATSYTLQSEDYSGPLYTSVYQIDAETDSGDIYVEDIKFIKSLNAKTTTGDIQISNCHFDILSAESTTGSVTLSKTTCVELLEAKATTGSIRIRSSYAKEIKAKASTGDITFREVNALKTITAETSTGDIDFTDCDAQSFYTKATTGDITGTVLTAKTFKVESNTGKVSFPFTTYATNIGFFEAKTTTGDINLSYSEN